MSVESTPVNGWQNNSYDRLSGAAYTFARGFMDQALAESGLTGQALRIADHCMEAALTRQLSGNAFLRARLAQLAPITADEGLNARTLLFQKYIAMLLPAVVKTTLNAASLPPAQPLPDGFVDKLNAFRGVREWGDVPTDAIVNFIYTVVVHATAEVAAASMFDGILLPADRAAATDLVGEYIASQLQDDRYFLARVNENLAQPTSTESVIALAGLYLRYTMRSLPDAMDIVAIQSGPAIEEKIEAIHRQAQEIGIDLPLPPRPWWDEASCLLTT